MCASATFLFPLIRTLAEEFAKIFATRSFALTLVLESSPAIPVHNDGFYVVKQSIRRVIGGANPTQHNCHCLTTVLLL